MMNYDDSAAFDKPEMSIESVCFISDSTMIVLLRNEELRIINT